MDKITTREISNILKDILNGYNKIKHRSFGEIYIKHYTAYDNAMIDDKKEEFYNDAIQKGLIDNKQRIEHLIQDGQWTKDEDSKIIEFKRSISNLRDTKVKLLIEAQKVGIQNKINQQTKEVEDLENKKASLIGFTAEAYSSKKANEYFIFESLRKDKSLVQRFFNEEEFDDLDNFTLGELIEIYNNVTSRFVEINLKRASYSSTFLNLFYMSPESVYEFYGKPVLELTFYQIEAYSNAKIFKNLISNAKYPPSTEVYLNPDSIIEWMDDAKVSNEAGDNLNSSSSNGNKEDVGSGGSYVGASKEDLRKIAKDGDNIISLSAEARKMGGSLNMNDIMKLHGIKV